MTARTATTSRRRSGLQPPGIGTLGPARYRADPWPALGSTARRSHGMAQRKPKAGRGGGGRPSPARQRPRDDAGPGNVAGLRDLLGRRVLLSTDRLQETLDDAVRRGRMRRADAEELLAALISVGRRQTDELLADLDTLVERSRGAAADASRRM